VVLNSLSKHTSKDFQIIIILIKVHISHHIQCLFLWTWCWKDTELVLVKHQTNVSHSLMQGWPTYVFDWDQLENFLVTRNRPVGNKVTNTNVIKCNKKEIWLKNVIFRHRVNQYKIRRDRPTETGRSTCWPPLACSNESWLSIRTFAHKK